MTNGKLNKDNNSSYVDQSFGCDERLEFNYPDDTQEFTNLSQDREFQHEEYEETKKTKSKLIQKLLTAFIASTFTLVSAVSLIPSDSSNQANNQIIEPENPIVNDVIEEYDIVGFWSDGNESYRFLQNGKGYYTDGKYFILLDWEKVDNDYHYYGGGINEIEKNSFSFWNIDATSTMSSEGLILNNSNHFVSTFKKAELNFDDSFILSILDLSFEERIQGFYEYQETVSVSPDVSDLKPSYYLFDNQTISTDIGSDDYHYYEHFVVDYEILDNYQIKATGEFIYEVSRDNHTYRYINNDFYYYYFLTQDKECILADVFSGKHILYKTELPF